MLGHKKVLGHMFDYSFSQDEEYWDMLGILGNIGTPKTFGRNIFYGFSDLYFPKLSNIMFELVVQ